MEKKYSKTCDGKISIVIPVYEVQNYLTRCVESILRQTYKNLEIILVDDGSTDNCSGMCDEYAEKDERVIVIHKKNEGLGLTRNAGLEIATGEYVTFIDSDDWISDDHVENLYCAAKEMEADVIIGNYTNVYSSGKRRKCDIGIGEMIYEGERITTDIIMKLIGAKPDDITDVLLESSCCTNLYKMKLLSDNCIRFISERYAVAEDFFFNLDFLCCANRVAFIKESGYFYFENVHSISRKYNPQRFDRTINYYSVFMERIIRYGLPENAFRRMQRSFLMKVRVAIRHIATAEMRLGQKMLRIEEILKHRDVKTVLETYPIELLPFMMRHLYRYMKDEKTVLVYLIVFMREIVRKCMHSIAK